MTTTSELIGRLVLEDRIVGGRLVIEDDRIARVDHDASIDMGPLLAPGFIDVHVHGWGGHDAMGGRAALDGMARALARRGVTSFLPTAVSAPLDDLGRFADAVRAWLPAGPRDGAAGLGFNLEGPFLAPERRGAHDPGSLCDPADLRDGELDPLLDGLRVITVAPERPGALELIAALAGRGVRVALGHSAATLDESRAGYHAGAVSTTHLFNAMTGLGHHEPGLAAAALLDDAVYTELIADGHHVHPAMLALVARQKPADRLVLVSDAISLAGLGDGTGRLGGLDVEVADGRVTLAGTSSLAGTVIALDDAVRNLVAGGVALTAAVAAASANPAALLGETERGRLAVGQIADLVELDDALRVRRVMRAGTWLAGEAA